MVVQPYIKTWNIHIDFFEVYYKMIFTIIIFLEKLLLVSYFFLNSITSQTLRAAFTTFKIELSIRFL